MGSAERALPEDELSGYVDALAARIASFPPTAVALAKESVANADTMPLHEGLKEEAYLFQRTIRDDAAQRRMATFTQVGGQTRDGELNLLDTLDRLGDSS